MQPKKSLKFWSLIPASFFISLLFLSAIPAGAQTTYPEAILVNNFKIVIKTRAIEFRDGKWTYNFWWERARDAEGSVTISPRTNESSSVASMDPAPKSNMSGTPLVARLDPATRYVFKYFVAPRSSCDQNNPSDPECAPIESVYFNTRDQNGNIVDTANIPVSRGGTMANPSPDGSTPPSNASLSALQAQINQLLALVQSLMSQLSARGITLPGQTGATNPSGTPAAVVTNAPRGFTCSGTISTSQAETIASSHRSTGNTSYTVTTPAGAVTCRYTGDASTDREIFTFKPDSGVYMVMRANDEGYNGPRNAPEPLLVMINGRQYRNSENTLAPDVSNTRTVETYASVGRRFISGIHFYIPSTEVCENNPKVRIEVVKSEVPPGLTFSPGPDKTKQYYDKGACTYATLVGSPTTPGRYLFEYKITNSLGSSPIVSTSKVYIVVKKTNVFTMDVLQNYNPPTNDGNVSVASNPVIGGRSMIVWDQTGLTRGVTTFYRMDLWIAPGDQTGKNPDFITNKYLIATVNDNALVCNSSTSAGTASTDPLAWGCSRYNWLVGNTLGPNLSAGPHTLFLTPYLPVLDRENIVPNLYMNSDDGGTAYGYASKLINITGSSSNLSPDTPGTYGDLAFMRGGINYIRKSSSGAVLGQGLADFGLGRGTTININPGDSLELSWRAYFPASATQSTDRDAGSAWSSGIRVTNGLTSYEVANAQRVRTTTSQAFPNIPGGFDNVEVDGFMNSARGSYTITSAQTSTLTGLGFSLRYTPHLYGCANLATFSNPSLANFQASSDTNTTLQYGQTDCMLSISSDAMLFVNVGVLGFGSNPQGELPLGNANTNNITTSAGTFNTDSCRLPDQINMSQALSPSFSPYDLITGENEGSGYDSYTATFANLRNWNDASGRPYRYNKAQFMVSTSREAVAGGCTSGNCIVNESVSTIGSTSVVNPVANRTGAQFVGSPRTPALTPNTTYYNRLVYTCDGVSGSRDVIWPATTSGPGNISTLSGATPSSPSTPASSSTLPFPTGSGTEPVQDTSCVLTGPNSFYAGWNNPSIAGFNLAGGDEIVFRSKAGSPWVLTNGVWTKTNPSLDDTAKTAIGGGCPGVEPGSTNLNTCLKDNNVDQNSSGATFYGISGAVPRTTYWNRVAYVKNFTGSSPTIPWEKTWSCNMP